MTNPLRPITHTIVFLSVFALLLNWSSALSLSYVPEHVQQPLHHVHAEPPFTRAGNRWTASSEPSSNGDGKKRAGDHLLYGTFLDALDVMQSHFFTLTYGTWLEAIDWTATLMNTHVAASLRGVSRSIHSPAESSESKDWNRLREEQENTINRYFSQSIAFFFGENSFALRTQAYDDMLWVVLDWLENIRLIDEYDQLRCGYLQSTNLGNDERGGYNCTPWYGQQFVPQFAHRARLFYDIASRGWDETLCGGGMIWSPWLKPYKNAITNELFIAASVSMYLYFPGDDNASPFSDPTSNPSFDRRLDEDNDKPPGEARDLRYLKNAIKAYDWLKSSGMRNYQGLYVDGFHITGWKGGNPGSNGTGQCDHRNEKVFTYNQGVILSALKDLWEATGDTTYLDDGYELIEHVIAATGWPTRDGPLGWRWAGLGRNGVLEESCDWIGMCNQDGQAFKGIFFHHFSSFCEALPVTHSGVDEPDYRRTSLSTEKSLRDHHRKKCASYIPWVDHNARAALLTKDIDGEMGMWWGRRSKASRRHGGREETDEFSHRLEAPPADQGTDYRNGDVPFDDIWRFEDDLDFGNPGTGKDWMSRPLEGFRMRKPSSEEDINDRGRGRTVETQSGGLAVLRAAWKLRHHALDADA